MISVEVEGIERVLIPERHPASLPCGASPGYIHSPCCHSTKSEVIHFATSIRFLRLLSMAAIANTAQQIIFSSKSPANTSALSRRC